MKTLHTKTTIKKLTFFMAICMLFAFEVNAQQCSGGSYYGEKPSTDVADYGLRASMDFDNDLNAVVVRNQGVTYGPNTIGTPYVQNSFATAKIAPVGKVYLVRYNALMDEMEVKSSEKEDILIISKKKNYVINQHANNVTYRVLKKVDSEKENDLGYYISLQENKNVSLYRKQCKKLVKRNKATYGGTASTVTTEFKDMRCEFYIEKAHDGHAIKIPKRKKDFLALFPEKADLISAFIKENRIKLNKEKSLKKLITYINTI
ncbi:hypothetical protein KORDIASMS9_00719 [Kordia sp. SMS9]|uniref:hypothetical protein n=1 Tax=Kordia sp. SMS9 TaxID=2282170 RepID=UPI000E0D9371|nr:hypothetical protein [Kordia sp. SMS9]AXG68504.1 hypothetical protein KORDIASMS9_00719 [Kordia sp. SMS9]